MPKKIAIVGASGKLGGATLSALQSHNLHPTSDIIALTSSAATSSPQWTSLSSLGVEVRHATFEDPATFESALEGVDVFFLVSTPQIGLDFGLGSDYDGTVAGGTSGRESRHRGAIDAAVRAGVSHIVYSSLAFGFSSSSTSSSSSSSGGILSLGTQSRAGVMRAHLRTEAYLDALTKQHPDLSVTVLREGLYSESWPLYLGYFDTSVFFSSPAPGTSGTDGGVVKVPLAGDGKVNWTSIKDLGIASAVVLASGAEFKNRAFYLSTSPARAKTVSEMAAIVRDAANELNKDGPNLAIHVELVGTEDHVRYYVEKRGKPQPAVEWWVTTYEALEAGECLIDEGSGNGAGGMLEKLLARVGVQPVPVEETVKDMIRASKG